MKNSILGLHHITAIAGYAKRNMHFYSQVLGVRMVKKTVNFDDPGTYHFYYGNEVGSPGTILTFFPWEGIGAGKNGTGMATSIGYAVPAGSLSFWIDRFNEYKVRYEPVTQQFGEQTLRFTDPDGLNIALIEPATPDPRTAWTTDAVGVANATRGFHNVVLNLQQVEATGRVLTNIFGYRQQLQEGEQYRFVTSAVGQASIVDLQLSPGQGRGVNAAGTNHHVAFRVENEEVLMNFREKIASAGFSITPKIDRDYFFSLYFREPGGVLFELATDNPGFATDEDVANLGSSLRLPKQYESSRATIEAALPALG